MSECENCFFWKQHEGKEARLEGTCKRFPPVFISLLAEHLHCARPNEGIVSACLESNHAWIQPTTDIEDWCGEWKAKEDSQAEVESK